MFNSTKSFKWKQSLLTIAVASILSACGTQQSSTSAAKAEFLPAPAVENPYLVEEDIYIRGSMNGWGATDKLKKEGNVYTKVVALKPGYYEFKFADQNWSCGSDFSPASDSTSIGDGKVLPADDCGGSGNFNIEVAEAGEYKFYLDLRDQENKKIGVQKFVAQTNTAGCPVWTGGAVTVKVGDTFKDGDVVKDYYSGSKATVKNGEVTMTPAAGSNGILLIEKADSKPTEFSWDNASVYFVMTDRFENGDPSNDNSYGRTKDGADEIGTFHGGDLKGLTKKLDHIEELGMNAIWITAPYEQIRGWVGGGRSGDFKHYAYHGYYVGDFTKLDANMGTEDDLQTFVDEAHKRGIRVLFDIVMNHTGYATLADMQAFKFGDFFQMKESIDTYLGETWTDWKPGKGQTWHSFNDYIDYDSEKWMNWWGKDWIRTDIAAYDEPGRGDEKMSLAYLPDFKTESTKAVDLPPFYKNKPDTNAKYMPNTTVRGYLVKWLSDWVENYGIDGFRVDTVKHVEKEAWAELKVSASKAFETWKKNNPDKVISDDPFWMTGEYWGQGLEKVSYFQNGFDSLINFTYQESEAASAMACMSDSEKTFAHYANVINADKDFNVLTYISSHDTSLYFDRYAKNKVENQAKIAAPFLLLPGGVQVYYGDETARPFGPTGSDNHQGTRSDMNWADLSKSPHKELLAHWQKIGQFRNKHAAIGAGEHKKVSDAPYAFSRTLGDDKVLVVFAGNEQ